ncbi:hypothetical protein QJS66_17975 [Kocuria rhizophila]|nr:hypothetical protein QJS66_17975 [Kocuria rhizophila]
MDGTGAHGPKSRARSPASCGLSRPVATPVQLAHFPPLAASGAQRRHAGRRPPHRHMKWCVPSARETTRAPTAVSTTAVPTQNVHAAAVQTPRPRARPGAEPRASMVMASRVARRRDYEQANA